MSVEKKYSIECIKYQKIIFSPLKKAGFIPENGSEVFVRNIPTRDTECDLLPFFESAGDIFQVRLMMNENGKDNRGFAYITYVHSNGARKAVDTLNDVPYKGLYFLKIENSLNNCRLFIGGIPTHKTKDQVWQELYKSGIKNIVDVIMYRSYSDRAENRGFVFVEFRTHEEAAYFRARYGKSLRLWGTSVIVDWSVPIPPADSSVMEKVKILYLRNLEVSEPPETFQATLLRFTEKHFLEKIFKFKNYAFVHLQTREEAEKLKTRLEDHYKGTPVEVEWAKPPNKYTTQEYRQKKVSSLSVRSSSLKIAHSTLHPTTQFVPSLVSKKLQDVYFSPAGSHDIQHYSSSEELWETPRRTSTPIPTCYQTTTHLRPIMCSVVTSAATSRTPFPNHISRFNFASPPSPFFGSEASVSSPSLSPDASTPSPALHFGTLAPLSLFCSHVSTPSSWINSSSSSVSSKLNFLDRTPSPTFSLPCSPIISPIRSQSPLQNFDPVRSYQRNMAEIYENCRKNPSKNLISIDDFKVIPRNLEEEHLLILSSTLQTMRKIY